MAKSEQIKTFRIGNEIQIRWPILTNGEEQTLDGRDLTLILSDQWGNDRQVKTFGTEGNVIVFTFLASDQFKTGIYRLTLFENMGKAHQLATDYCFAFKLVAHSCDIPDDMAVEELPLDSTNVDVGIRGESAYEIAVRYGYEGSEEQWMAEFNTVLSSTQIVTDAVTRAEQVLSRTEELFVELSTIQEQELNRSESETNRSEAEAQRQENESQRQSQEQERESNERNRVEAEQNRSELFQSQLQQQQQTFESSEQSRQSQFQQKQSELSQTASENEQSRSQSYIESEQARQHTFEEHETVRNGAVAQVIRTVEDAETLRVEAESERVENEQNRVLAEQQRAETFEESEQQRQHTFEESEQQRS